MTEPGKCPIGEQAMELLTKLAEGYSLQDAADRLGIRRGTAGYALHKAREDVGVENNVQLAIKATLGSQCSDH